MSEVKPDMVEGPSEGPPSRHCWHRSPRQHTNLNLHADIRCCHCGEDRCVKLKAEQPKGHGQHAPDEEWKLVPIELISTKGCPGATRQD